MLSARRYNLASVQDINSITPQMRSPRAEQKSVGSRAGRVSEEATHVESSTTGGAGSVTTESVSKIFGKHAKS